MITGHNVSPDQPAWREASGAHNASSSPRRSQAWVTSCRKIDASTVIARVPAEDPRLSSSVGTAADAGELLDRVLPQPAPPVTGTTPPPAPAVFPLRSALTTRSKAPVPQLALVKCPAPAPRFWDRPQQPANGRRPVLLVDREPL